MTRASEYVDLLVRVYGFAYVLSRFAYSASWPPFINQTWPAHHSKLICLCGFVGLLMFWAVLLTLLRGRLLLIKHDLRIRVRWFACAGIWVCLCFEPFWLRAAFINPRWPAWIGVWAECLICVHRLRTPEQLLFLMAASSIWPNMTCMPYCVSCLHGMRI